MVTEQQASQPSTGALPKSALDTTDVEPTSGHIETLKKDEESTIRSLESDFRSDNLKHINNVVDLINLISPDKRVTTKAIHAARRCIKIIEKAPTPTVQTWLSARQNQYAHALENVLRTSTQTSCIEAAIAAAALTHGDVWRSVLRVAIPSNNTDVKQLTEHFLSRFSDLRLTALELICQGIASVPARLEILSACHHPTDDFAREEVDQKSIKRAFSAAWLSILREDLSISVIQQVLKRIPTELIPNMHNPLSLADFLTSCYDCTSNVSIAIQALDGLFILVSKHRLDYPLFYPKLYALLTEEALFYAEGRGRFLELTGNFLVNGGMLPGTVVAAFIKRLLRRALTAPADGALWCLRLALGLLYKHPNTAYLVHRSINLFESDVAVSSKRKRPHLSDPFDDVTPNPQESHADETSLWELQVLEKHVSPAVSRLVAAFSKDVRKNPLPPPGNLNDYIGLDFDDLYNAETKRRAKSSHLAYDVPGSAPGLAELNARLMNGISWA